jgi:hypothetical protein
MIDLLPPQSKDGETTVTQDLPRQKGAGDTVRWEGLDWEIYDLVNGIKIAISEKGMPAIHVCTSSHAVFEFAGSLKASRQRKPGSMVDMKKTLKNGKIFSSFIETKLCFASALLSASSPWCNMKNLLSTHCHALSVELSHITQSPSPKMAAV